MRTSPLLQKAMAFHQSGNLAQAQVIYLQILKTCPQDFESLRLLATIKVQTKNYQSAIELLNSALLINQSIASVYYNLGISQQHLNHLVEAVASYDKAININPTFSEAYYNRGNVLFELNHLDEAVASYKKAISINSSHFGAYYNLGKSLQHLNHLVEAVASYDKAININPTFSEAYYNRGLALQQLNQLAQAVDSYDNAIRINVAFPEAYWNKSIAFLLGGSFEKGWELFEWRWKRGGNEQPRHVDKPRWLGNGSLKNKKLLIWSEQGLGDVIQFSRYASLAQSEGARVTIEAPMQLKEVLSSLDKNIEVVGKGAYLEDFDLQIPVMSLPMAFKTQIETIPNKIPYLFADDKKVKQWAGMLGASNKLRVGLVWSGSNAHHNDVNRSILLKSLFPIFSLSAEFHSLQIEYRENDLDILEKNSHVFQHQHEIHNFSDTAALIENLDLVISVDTSVVHLAGALGKSVWIMLPYSPDYRWLLHKNDSPWYPTARLFRQPKSGDWESVIEEIRSELQKLIIPIVSI